MFQALVTNGDESAPVILAASAYADFAKVHGMPALECPGRDCQASLYIREASITEGCETRATHYATHPRKDNKHIPHCAYDSKNERKSGGVSLSHALAEGLPIILNINIKALGTKLSPPRSKEKYKNIVSKKVGKKYATYSVKDIRGLLSFMERVQQQSKIAPVTSPVFISYKRTLRPINKAFLSDKAENVWHHLTEALKRTSQTGKKKDESKNYTPPLPMIMALVFNKSADGRFYSDPIMLSDVSGYSTARPFVDKRLRNATLPFQAMRFVLETADPVVSGMVAMMAARGREVLLMAAPEKAMRNAAYSALTKRRNNSAQLSLSLMGHKIVDVPVQIAHESQIMPLPAGTGIVPRLSIK